MITPNTIKAHTETLDIFGSFLASRNMPQNVSAISREHVVEFIADQVGRRKANTAPSRYQALESFFNWLVEEGETTTSSMEKIRAPHVPEAAPDVLMDEQLRRLPKSCDGSSFAEMLLLQPSFG